MKKLLIAYDGTAGGDAALEDLAQAGLPDHLEVLVLTVADVWLPPESTDAEPTFPEDLPEAVKKARAEAAQAVEQSRQMAQQAADRLTGRFRGWTVRAQAAADSPAWAVVKVAGTWRSDLIVLGSHGRSMLERLFLGSTAQKVAAEAHCSVRIVRPRRSSPDGKLKIMLSVDGSPHSDAMVHWVAARPWPEATEFRAVAVIDPQLESAVSAPSAFAQRWIQPDDRGPDDWVRRILEHVNDVLQAPGRRLETEVLRGEPKQLLLREAERWAADSLFLGARGLHHRERLFLGSTVSALTARASCTVEIVRPIAV